VLSTPIFEHKFAHLFSFKPEKRLPAFRYYVTRHHLVFIKLAIFVARRGLKILLAGPESLG
jgi:hypothetical protein